MQDDPIPSATAPDPIAATASEPSAPPVAVTSATSVPPNPSRRRNAVALIAGILVFDLLVAAGVWLYLGPKAGAASASIPVGVESALRSRIASGYPGYTVDAVKSFSRDDPESPDGLTSSVHFTMKSVEHPGFQFSLVYYAPASQAGNVTLYTSDDEFFRAGAFPAQPVDSFIKMWQHTHPGEDCFSVMEGTTDSMDDIRTYVVAATRYENNGGAVTSVIENYDFHYTAATDSWVEIPRDAIPTEVSGAFVDTATAVAQAFPGFEYVATQGDALDNPSLVIRSVKYPKMQVLVYPYMLDGGDPNDGIVKMFTGDRTKADAFVKAFVAKYPDSVLWEITFDPNGESDENLVSAWSEPSGDTIRLRYNAKTHVWTKVK